MASTVVDTWTSSDECFCCTAVPLPCCPPPEPLLPSRMYLTVTAAYVYDVSSISKHEPATCDAKVVGTYPIDYDATSGDWLYSGPALDGSGETVSIDVSIDCFGSSPTFYRARIVSFSFSVCPYGITGQDSDDDKVCGETPPTPLYFHHTAPASYSTSVGPGVARVNDNTNPTVCCVAGGFIVRADMDWNITA